MITNSKIVDHILPACIMTGANAHNIAMSIRGEVLLQMQATKRANRIARFTKQPTKQSTILLDVIGILSLIGVVLVSIAIYL